jgi:hypothetical protein
LIILRHDVDDAFSTNSLFSKGLNYLSLKFRKFFPRWKNLGYLQDTLKLFERELEIGVQSSWFFRTSTTPFPELRKELLAKGHEIGFHADRIEDESFFRKDLEYVAQGNRIFGFTKHGSRGLLTPMRVGLGEVYNLALYIRRARDLGLSYFAGNNVNPTDKRKIIDGVVVFPSVFWVSPGYMNDQKFTVGWLIKHQKDCDVVVLVHPLEASGAFPKVAEKVDKIYTRCQDFVSFKKYLEMLKLL